MCAGDRLATRDKTHGARSIYRKAFDFYIKEIGLNARFFSSLICMLPRPIALGSFISILSIVTRLFTRREFHFNSLVSETLGFHFRKITKVLFARYNTAFLRWFDPSTHPLGFLAGLNSRQA